mmetsp:Transcript_4609/g.8117  ORF Transcript_4609/g.8117 Transcript_4609/m.8117 type:complete len:231 (+) Transcript_4609:447-1139(+)
MVRTVQVLNLRRRAVTLLCALFAFRCPSCCPNFGRANLGLNLALSPKRKTFKAEHNTGTNGALDVATGGEPFKAKGAGRGLLKHLLNSSNFHTFVNRGLIHCICYTKRIRANFIFERRLCGNKFGRIRRLGGSMDKTMHPRVQSTSICLVSISHPDDFSSSLVIVITSKEQPLGHRKFYLVFCSQTSSQLQLFTFPVIIGSIRAPFQLAVGNSLTELRRSGGSNHNWSIG